MKYLSLLLPLLFQLFFTALPAQADELSIAARGTGRTTGHIANLTVTNNSDRPITLLPGTYFIPASSRYQSYVGRIPGGQTIPPGQSATIPVSGYCTNVHTPPVPSGVPTTDFPDWVLVGDSVNPGIPISIEPTVPEPMNPPGGSTSMETRLVPDHIAPPFSTSDIPGIINSSGYQRTSEQDDQPNGGITITFPGTDIPVGGTIDLNKEPERYAPLVVEILVQVEEAATRIQNNPDISTPFSGAPIRESEALVQQTIWIVTAALIDDDYTREDFADNTHRQFTEATGRTVASLEEEEREQLDGGVEDFWGAFTAVGIEAKVFRTPENGSPATSDVSYQDTSESTTGEGTTNNSCQCEEVSFSYLEVAYSDGGLDGSVGTPRIQFPSTKTYPISGGEETITVNASKLQNRFSFDISDVKITCSCTDEGSCTTSSGPYLDLGESRGADEVGRAETAAEEMAAKIKEQAEEVARKAEEAAAKAAERAEGKAEDEPSEDEPSTDEGPQGEPIDGPATESVELTKKEDPYSIFVKLPRGQRKTIRFTISGTCSSDDCGIATCEKTFVINIERPKEEEKEE